jgi:surfactin synthase thioesterase subunit
MQGSPDLRLFCFPHAGGAASNYRAWEADLPDSVELCAIQLPGREARFNEPLVISMSSLFEQLRPEIEPLLNRPAVLFGHSVGAVTAYAMALKIDEWGLPAPARLCISAYPSPRLKVEHALRSTMSDAEFANRVMELNDYSPDLINNSELLRLMIPVIRADVELTEGFTNHGRLLSCPLDALGGEGDRGVSLAALQDWQALTTGSFALRTFPGGHFFTQQNRQEILSHILRAR